MKESSAAPHFEEDDLSSTHSIQCQLSGEGFCTGLKMCPSVLHCI